MEEIFESRINLTELNLSITKIKDEISKVIIGQKQLIDLFITAILSDGHVLVEGCRFFTNSVYPRPDAFRYSWYFGV